MALLILNAAEGSFHFLLARLAPLEPLCSQDWRLPSQGAELLAPALQQTLAALRISPASLTHIACVRGPGSFTGLRLALVTASGLARTSAALLAGLDYLPLLALQAGELPFGDQPSPDGAGVVWTLTYARRRQVHLQGFVLTGGGETDACPQETKRDAPHAPKEASPDAAREADPFAGKERWENEGRTVRSVTDILVLSLEAAADFIARRQEELGGRALILGSGLTRNRAAWEALRPRLPEAVLFLPPHFDAPYDAVLLRAAATAVYTRRDITPLYVRPSEAEENLERISASLRLNPEAARKRLAELTRTLP